MIAIVLKTRVIRHDLPKNANRVPFFGTQLKREACLFSGQEFSVSIKNISGSLGQEMHIE